MDVTGAADGTRQLHVGVLSLPMVVAAVALALSLLISFQLVAMFAGVAVPLAYLVSFAIVLMLGVVLGQLAKAMPSAGGYYVYVSRTLYPRVGLLVAWQYFLFVALVPAVSLTFAGFLINSTLVAEYGMRGSMVGADARRHRVQRGAGIADPGPGGLNVASFVPTNVRSARGLYLGVLFTVFAFARWEALAPLTEETRRPRRSVPIAIVGAITLLGVFMVLSSCGLVIGWGTNRVAALAHSSSFPPFVLA